MTQPNPNAPDAKRHHPGLSQGEAPDTPIEVKIKRETSGLLKLNTVLAAMGALLMLIVSILLNSLITKVDTLNTSVIQLTTHQEQTQKELDDHEARIRLLELSYRQKP